MGWKAMLGWTMHQREKGRSANRNTLGWLWEISRGYRIGIGMLLVIQMSMGFLGVGSAMLLRALIDAAVAVEQGAFWGTAALFAGLLLAENGLAAAARFLYAWTCASLENRMKGNLFSCLLHKDYAAVTAVHSGDWLNRLTSDTTVVADGMVSILPSLGGMVARLTGALAALLFLQPAFFYILVPAGLAMALLTLSLRKIMKRLHKGIQEAGGRVLSFFQERLESLMIVRVFSMESRTEAEAARRMDGHKAARMRKNHFSNLCSGGFGLLADGGYLLGAVYCGYGILNGTISYGTLIAVLQLVGQVQSPMANLTGAIPRYFAMTASAERLMEAEDCPDDGAGTPVPAGEIQSFYRKAFRGFGLRDASFSYRTADDGNNRLNVIRHFDLNIQKGEYVAFTGHSGCGKSTLLKLLMCLYPLDEGERYIRTGENGREERIPLTPAWRGLFAYVPQGNQLMSGTIREMVAFGDPAAMAQEERLMQALRVACADGFVAELEKGVDTCLGEHGAGLSEGQMQRIAIARAIFSDRPVLILDECTSALDEGTEQKLLTNLRRMTDKTVLLITHRPAALGICDRKIEMGDPAK